HRMGCAENLICALTGAADACFVNNNAAAVLLTLNTLAEGQEVIVSRGQLVEIGGSFRVPDIMAKSGAILREVGATNKTHLADYCQAITAQTALLLAVHQSNFSQLGFVAQVELASLVELARQRKLSVMCDLGSGCLYPFAEQGVGCEPLITQVLAAGVDIVTVSGDKLLGGPQCGIILGDRHKIQQIKENPFYRAFRLDKLTIAAVEATLLLYRSGHSERIPLIAMVTAIPQVLQERAERLRQLVADCPGLYAKTVETEAEIGGGSMPGVKLPGYAVAINHNRYTAAVLAGELRQNQPAIIAYIRNEQVMLDIRTVMDEEIQLIAQALFKICREGVD
ncbi:MAG: L-seryl-tRNA(Sec) selenium transferase, partial [Clostridiales bacterium]